MQFWFADSWYATIATSGSVIVIPAPAALTSSAFAVGPPSYLTCP
jgi:hypothetical protein